MVQVSIRVNQIRSTTEPYWTLVRAQPSKEKFHRCLLIIRADQEYLRTFSIWRSGIVAKQNQMKQIRQELRIKYKAMYVVRKKAETESARQLAEQKEKVEEKKYRISTEEMGQD